MEKGGAITLPCGITYLKLYLTCTTTGAIGLIFLFEIYKKQANVIFDFLSNMWFTSWVTSMQ